MISKMIKIFIQKKLRKYGWVAVHEKDLIAMEENVRNLRRYVCDLSSFGYERVLRLGELVEDK